MRYVDLIIESPKANISIKGCVSFRGNRVVNQTEVRKQVSEKNRKHKTVVATHTQKSVRDVHADKDGGTDHGD